MTAMGRGALAPLLRRFLLGSRSPLALPRAAPERHQSGFILHKISNRTEQFSTSTSFLLNTRNHAFHKFLATQTRWASHVASAKSTEPASKISIGPRSGNSGDKDTGVIYYGPISSTIKKVKLLSLSTCCLSVSLGPVITFMTSPDMNVILKGAVASTVIMLSASTTAALHSWFVSPYIHKLRWQPGPDSVEVEMMSWLATYIPRTIRFIDIQPA